MYPGLGCLRPESTSTCRRRKWTTNVWITSIVTVKQLKIENNSFLWVMPGYKPASSAAVGGWHLWLTLDKVTQMITCTDLDHVIQHWQRSTRQWVMQDCFVVTIRNHAVGDVRFAHSCGSHDILPGIGWWMSNETHPSSTALSVPAHWHWNSTLSVVTIHAPNPNAFLNNISRGSHF